MNTVDDLIGAVGDSLPNGVIMSHCAHPMLDGISFFFVGPNGRAGAPIYGLTDTLDNGNMSALVSEAVAKAATVA